ncbi:MAG: ABC transporter permease [Clostridiales bacterium]|nr:ABC transporter permease [Clostridiales bacterium]
MNKKVTKVFSWTLMKQSLRSNIALTVIATVVMCMMGIVITYAGNLLGSGSDETDYTDAQSDFYSYLYVLASYNEMAGTDLSYEDFTTADDTTAYETVFDMMNMQMDDGDFSVDGFASAADELSESEIPLETYISQFEYVYALGSVQGCFSGDDLDVETLMNNMFEMMGVSSDLMETMSEMDPSAMLNQMHYTVMVILPLLLFIIVVGNSLVVDQVDKGSMAYILSTPTKRSAVAITQMIYMILVPLVMIAIVCGVRMAAIYRFTGSVDPAQTIALYAGLYVLAEAMASICYFAGCVFNLSRYAMALGGGLNIWFFLASLLGMFGSENMVSMGIGVDALGIFNHLTLVGLFDIDALATVGSGDVDTAFVWKLCVLVAIAVVMYVVGAVRFTKKDLPL